MIIQGLPAVLTDPRTNLIQCLDALLVAELTDNAGWEMLIELAQGLKQTELAHRSSRRWPRRPST